jgi:hypothetical protein
MIVAEYDGLKMDTTYAAYVQANGMPQKKSEIF